MTIAERVAHVVTEREINQNARNFAYAAKWFCRAQGNWDMAAKMAKDAHALPPIVNCLKAAQTANSTSDASALAPYTTLASAFLSSLRNVSVFETALPFMPRVPFRTTVRLVSTGATAATINEASTKPVTRLSFTATDMTDQKTGCIISLTEELLRETDVRLFQNELELAIAAKLDADFIAKITAGISTTTSNGGTAAAVLADFAAGISALTLGGNSKVFAAVSPAIAQAWAFKTTSTGQRMFPELGINGGTIGDVTVFPTEGVSAQIVFFDATQIASADGGTEHGISKYAGLQLDTVGDSPPSASTNYISLWQLNMIGLRAERRWAAQRMRDTAVSVITSVSYTGNSPA
jgi:hypothetical protein